MMTSSFKTQKEKKKKLVKLIIQFFFLIFEKTAVTAHIGRTGP